MKSNLQAIRKGWFGRLAGVLVLGVILFFVGRYVYRNWALLKEHTWDIQWHLLLLSIVMVWGVYLLAVARWHAVLRAFRTSLNYRQAWRSWALPLLGKYIPGKVWSFLGRVYIATDEGASPGAAASAAAFAQLTAFPSKALVFLVMVPFMGFAPSEYQIALALSIVLVLMVVLHPRVLFFGLNLALKLLGREQVQFDLDYRTVLGLILASAGIGLLNGFAFSVFARSITPLEMSDLPVLVGAHPLAALLGLLSLFAPAGLGVKEGVLLAVLSQRFPPEAAIAISLGSRLWFTAAEVSFVAISWLLLRKPERRQQPDEEKGGVLVEPTQ